ncbi:MAG: hypothetical protein Q4B91_05485 [Atopobiaceae bacterium]|nr:hypothetical protein [Atopobiaceae bacterium]
MKLTRRTFLSSAAAAASFLLIPKSALAAQTDDVGEFPDESPVSVEIIDEDTFSIQDSYGTWIVSISESGPYRITAAVAPDGSQETISYNRKTGEAYSSATVQVVILGVDETYQDVPETKGVIDHDPQPIYNGPSRKETEYISYQQLKSIAGSVSNVAGILIAIAGIVGFSIVGTFVAGFVNDNIGRILDALSDGDPNHGLKLKVTLTERYTIHPTTGAHIYYDTLRTVNSVSFY